MEEEEATMAEDHADIPEEAAESRNTCQRGRQVKNRKEETERRIRMEKKEYTMMVMSTEDVESSTDSHTTDKGGMEVMEVATGVDIVMEDTVEDDPLLRDLLMSIRITGDTTIKRESPL